MVLFTVRVHPFPFRTRKLSSLVPKILGWRRPGKIGICQHIYSSLAQSVEHAAVNRRVVGSSPTGGARNILPLRIFRGGNIFFFPCGFSFTVCFLRVTPECCESIFGAACALRKIALIRRLFYLFVFMTALRIRQRGQSKLYVFSIRFYAAAPLADAAISFCKGYDAPSRTR